MAKTPYELRFDFINLAMSHLRDEYFAAQERHNSHQHNEHIPFAIDYPTLEDALKLAERIQQFVSDNRS